MMNVLARAGLFAVLLAVLVAVPTAGASWLTSGSGPATARAGTLVTPTGVVAGPGGCAGLTARTVTVSWNDVAGVSRWQVETTAGTAAPTVTVTSTNRATVTITNVGTGKSYAIRVRPAPGAWTGPWSAPVTGRVSLLAC